MPTTFRHFQPQSPPVTVGRKHRVKDMKAARAIVRTMLNDLLASNKENGATRVIAQINGVSVVLELIRGRVVYFVGGSGAIPTKREFYLRLEHHMGFLQLSDDFDPDDDIDDLPQSSPTELYHLA